MSTTCSSCAQSLFGPPGGDYARVSMIVLLPGLRVVVRFRGGLSSFPESDCSPEIFSTTYAQSFSVLWARKLARSLESIRFFQRMWCDCAWGFMRGSFPISGHCTVPRWVFFSWSQDWVPVLGWIDFLTGIGCSSETVHWSSGRWAGYQGTHLSGIVLSHPDNISFTMPSPARQTGGI